MITTTNGRMAIRTRRGPVEGRVERNALFMTTSHLFA